MRTRTLFVTGLLCLFLTGTALSSPIIIRHDRSDADYLALGKKYPSVCFVGKDGEGTLIAPRWVLTAAHVAKGMPLDARKVRFGEIDHAVERVILHPDWEKQQADVALLKLAEPVKNIKPVELYSKTDETGKQIVFVGRGDTGTGLTGAKSMDRKVRGATNTVERADDQWIYFTFNKPENATEFEGISGPGDSGGPALFEQDGKLYTLGVSCWGDDASGDKINGTYGDLEAYARVSTYHGWISETMGRGAPKTVVEKTVVKGELAQKLDQFMALQENDNFSGALLVAKDGEVILAKGYGFADRENNVKTSPETIYDVGSLTKQFTAAAIMKLHEQGKLSPQDKLTKYFENVPADKAGITLHHLLTHGAGFPGGLGYDYAEVELDEFTKMAFEADLKFEPGKGYEYSNVGFALLAAIIEKVSGQPYDIYTRETLFKPAGMERTGYRIPKKYHKDVAVGYRSDKNWGKPNEKPWREHGPYWHLHGNGGTLSNVYDMFRWHLALLGDEILSAESKKQMYAPHNPEGPGGGSFYGYGWSLVKTQRGGQLITHNGGNPYFANDFLRFIDDDIVIMISSNNGERPATRLSRQIARLVFSGELPAEKKEISANWENSQQGKRAAAFLKNLTASDDKLRTIIKENFADDILEKAEVDGILEAVAPDRKFMKDGEILRAFQAGPEAMEIYAKNDKSGEWLKFDLQFEKEAPHKISGLGINFDNPPNSNTVVKTESAPAGSSDKWGLPGSPTGRRASEFLTAIHSGKEADLKKFIENSMDAEFAKQFSMADHLSVLGQTHKELGDFKVVGVVKTGPYSCQLNLKSGHSGAIFVANIELAQKPPHGIVGIRVEDE